MKEAVTYRELCSLVAKQTRTHDGMWAGYNVGECEDVLRALVVVVAEQLAKGKQIKIEGLGWFNLKEARPYTIKTPMVESGVIKGYRKNSAKFKPDQLFLNQLQDEINALNNADGED